MREKEDVAPFERLGYGSVLHQLLVSKPFVSTGLLVRSVHFRRDQGRWFGDHFRDDTFKVLDGVLHK